MATYDYGEWDFSRINEGVEYLLYELWKIPLKLWAILPKEVKWGIEISFFLIAILLIVYYWKRRDGWMHVHHSSTRSN